MEPAIARLVIGAAVGITLTQAVLWLFARGLSLRIHRTAIVAGLVLPIALLASYVISGRILVPTFALATNIPGAPSSTAASHHTVLNDAIYQFIPWEIAVRRAYASGHLPLWSDSLDGGSSPWANPQAGAVSPIAMVARLAPVEHHLLTALALKLLVAFQGAWLLARLLGSRRSLALLSGAAFSLGGGIMAWSLFPHSATAAWMPWLIAGSIRVTRRPTARNVATTAVITAAMLLSGHPETVLGGGILAVVCVISLGRRADGLHGFLRGVGASTAAAALGFMLAAPHIFPFAKLLPHTVRYHRMTASDEDSAARSQRLFHPVHGKLLKGATNPNAYGKAPYDGPGFVPVGGGSYAGLVALAGAAIALASGRRRCWPLMGTVAGIGVMVAQFLPVIRVVELLPLAGSVAWTRLVTTIPLCIGVCGAVGFSEITRHRRSPVLALVGVATAAAVSLAVFSSPAVVFLWLGVAAATMLLLWRSRFGIAALVVVALLDLGPWANAMLPRGDGNLFYPDTGFTRALQREVDGLASCRVVGLGYNAYPSLLSVYGIDDIRYHNPVTDYRYASLLGAAFGFHPEDAPYEYFSGFRRVDRRLLDFLNVGLVVSGGRQVPARFEEINSDWTGALRVYRNLKALPRAFIPIDASIVDPSQTFSAVIAMGDPRRVVLDRAEVGSMVRPRAKWAPQSVTWTREAPGLVTSTIGGDGERLLATSLTHPHGWSARSAGRTLQTMTVNHAFLGVIVPPGVGEITLRYVPPGFFAGFALCAVGLALTVAILLWRPDKR